jgi:cytochrome c peroxidase
MQIVQRLQNCWTLGVIIVVSAAVLIATRTDAQPAKPAPPAQSYAPVVDTETFDSVRRRMTSAKGGIEAKQKAHLDSRYDLGNKPIKGVTMFRGKAVQGGVRAKLPSGMTWEKLAAMSPDDIKKANAFPRGFMPLPHPNHGEGGMLFPQVHIDELKKQTGRDLTRFDLDFDLPQHLLPEFPPPMFLVTRPDLGDVSKGQLVTLANFYELFNGVLNPKDIEGLRLLVTPFPQQQFNATADRRSVKPHDGVSCFDCHANGHTNATTHLVGDIRPQPFRRRIDTPSLRGVGMQQIFGSQRGLKSIEDFTEFEQRAAYFDGDHVIAAKKGVNPLERGSQVHFMSEVQNLLDFPPAPKLGIDGRLDPAKASDAEKRGEALFNGKARCATCHPAPLYMDNLMHNLRVDRFYTVQDMNGRATQMEGPTKTFTLRGISQSPPYFHDGRLLTLEDTVEFFNIVLGTKLTAAEKQDLVAFLLTL